MAASVKSLSSLLAQASLDDHDEILKAANGAIKKNRSDQDAQHAKVVALLQLDRYEDALKVFEEVKTLQEKAQFEYAYSLYKTGNAIKAAEVAEAAGSNAGRGMKHMLAQAVRSNARLSMRQLGTDTRRHIGQRTSHKPRRSTKSSPHTTSKTKQSIFASTLGPWTHNWNGLARENWRRRRSPQGRIWSCLRRRSTLLVEALRVESLHKAKSASRELRIFAMLRI
jgi:tetratricopeptide (TPR) repeat protein